MKSAVEMKVRNAVGGAIMALSKYNERRLPMPKDGHPYLSGIHRPVTVEANESDLRVTGSIPKELNGRYIRIGPNPATNVSPASYNWFLGDGMIHGVRLCGGKALWYKNRWVRSDPVAAALNEAPLTGPRHRGSEAVNTNIVGHAGKSWAIVEAGAYPVEIGDDLESVAHNPFDGTLKGAYSAHPHLDPATGELHAICYYAFEPDFVRHIVVDQAGHVVRDEPVAVKNCPSIHDCAITPSSVLIFDLPVRLSMRALIKGHGFPFRWDAKHQARVGILPRNGRGEDVRWCDVDPCYLFHTCNAFEQADGTIIVDVIVYDRLFDDSYFGPDRTDTRFERWTIKPDANRVERAVIDSTPQEFPRFDERLSGLDYRYAYTMPLAVKGDDAFVSEAHLIKHDLVTGTRQTHEFGQARYPGEFVFVPKSPDAAEDEGWLLGYVIDAKNETTDLIILDAQNFDAPPQAIIHIPNRIPPGFHGNWIPDNG
jgi:8'-apo-carotenoid 13,14-cleaving dioxygenase